METKKDEGTNEKEKTLKKQKNTNLFLGTHATLTAYDRESKALDKATNSGF